ncbi:Trichodiene synthase-domain-containing protein [Mycena sanguinolenta]|nr:Trichodiene synthase-domain-containing protein [Mycena sanguinolenta]
MSGKEFPTQYFLGLVVRLLDTVQYKDVNYTHEQRVANLQYAYSKAAMHFARPHVQEGLKVKPKKLEAALRTITGMVVYCWINASQELMAALTIHYTYTLLLDDNGDDPEPAMRNFFGDMMAGKEQKHQWWKLVNNHLPNVLQHYGPFCSLNIYRSTVDFDPSLSSLANNLRPPVFEGCWIEQYAFQGYRGSEDYPDFLRRLNGLGHAVGTSIWLAAQFDEKALFREITTAVAMMENWMVWVNDLISYYKEFDDPRDQTSFVNNYCHVSDLTLDEGLEKLIKNTLRVTEQIVKVFGEKDPSVRDTLTKFMHGYITWHLCDKRYRIAEIYDSALDDETGRKFRHYFDEANKVGQVDPSEWTEPTFLSLAQEQEKLKLKVEDKMEGLSERCINDDCLEVNGPHVAVEAERCRESLNCVYVLLNSSKSLISERGDGPSNRGLRTSKSECIQPNGGGMQPADALVPVISCNPVTASSDVDSLVFKEQRQANVPKKFAQCRLPRDDRGSVTELPARAQSPAREPKFCGNNFQAAITDLTLRLTFSRPLAGRESDQPFHPSVAEDGRGNTSLNIAGH